MRHYTTLPDETEISYSNLLNENSAETVYVHFERPTIKGFDSARIALPAYRWLFVNGYSNTEINSFEELIKLHENEIISLSRMPEREN